jgi:alkylation response protein AidB-like acyl-CoA dehydrogenase
MGLAAQDTSELFFNDVRITSENLIGEVGQGFRYLTRFLAGERLIAAVGSIAAAQVAFEITLAYVQERKAFGRPIGTFQNARFTLAALRAEIDAIQTFVDQCVLLYNSGELTAEIAAEAKLLSSETEGRMTDAGVQLHGGAGYMDEYRISRLYTEARVSRIFAGSSEVMKEIIGRSLGLDERKLGKAG